MSSSQPPQSERAQYSLYLYRFFMWIGILLGFTFLLFLPYSFWWLYSSGDAAVERAVAAQARGDFVLFGSGLSQDFMDYKIRLYRAVKPKIIAIGSSRVMQFRGSWFRTTFVNMGGVAGNLAELRHAINSLLAVSRPDAVIIGIDFWWFMPQWEKNPQENIESPQNSYSYTFNSLKKPWEWLLTGKISPLELGKPFLGLFGKGFRADRYGIMAQRTNDGFGPDGSWYYTAEITGIKKPFDFQFKDTLKQVEHGIKAFYHAANEQIAPATEHLDAFAEIWCKLRARGIQTFVFMPPLAPRVYTVMENLSAKYPHLFDLRAKLQERGIEVMDFSDPRTLAASDCEFVDGFHGGEIAYARILARMADHWPALLNYVNMARIAAQIRNWHDHALSADVRLTDQPEIDFMNFGCKKTGKAPAGD